MLKKCPFCGGDAEVHEHCGCYYVRCNDCYSSGGIVQKMTFNETRTNMDLFNSAIEKWNRRDKC